MQWLKYQHHWDAKGHSELVSLRARTLRCVDAHLPWREREREREMQTGRDSERWRERERDRETETARWRERERQREKTFPLKGYASTSGRTPHERFIHVGSCLRPIDFCITRLKAQGPSRTCNESKEEEEVGEGRATLPLSARVPLSPLLRYCRTRSLLSQCLKLTDPHHTLKVDGFERPTLTGSQYSRTLRYLRHNPRHSPTVGSYEEAVSYERETPVDIGLARKTECDPRHERV